MKKRQGANGRLFSAIDARPESDIFFTLTAMSLPDAPNVLPLEGEIDLHVSPRVAASLKAIIEQKPERLPEMLP